MTDLLEAVDVLTKDTHHRVVQPVYETQFDAGGHVRVDDNDQPIRKVTGTKATKLVYPPLLTDLDAAIRGTLGGEGSSTSLKFTRNILNTEALHQFMRIRSLIRDWARLAGATRDTDPVVELRRWYHLWTSTEREEASIAWHTRTLTAWATTIRETIDPYQPWPLPGPCPNADCPQEEMNGLWFWWDQRTREQQTRPLLVEYRPADGPDMLMKARARCRACGTTWSNVRALQYDREHDDIHAGHAVE